MPAAAGKVLRQLIRALPDLSDRAERSDAERHHREGLKVPQIDLHALDKVKGAANRGAVELAA